MWIRLQKCAADFAGPSARVFTRFGRLPRRYRNAGLQSRGLGPAGRFAQTDRGVEVTDDVHAPRALDVGVPQRRRAPFEPLCGRGSRPSTRLAASGGGLGSRCAAASAASATAALHSRSSNSRQAPRTPSSRTPKVSSQASKPRAISVLVGPEMNGSEVAAVEKQLSLEPSQVLGPSNRSDCEGSRRCAPPALGRQTFPLSSCDPPPSTATAAGTLAANQN